MPSVRVRRGSQYASLYDGDGNNPDQAGNTGSDATRPRSRTLASIYHRTDPLAHINLTDGEPSTGAPLPNVERPTNHTGQSSSKVAGSILSGQQPPHALREYRSGDFAYGEIGPFSPSPGAPGNSRSITLEGSQADVVVPNDGLPGLLERQLSVASARSNPFRSSSEESLHHEDDIVEHLDVIDPQISTISNLANAANSILIPPIGYSRKPVVFLPRVPVSEYDTGKTLVHEDDLDRHVEGVLAKRAVIRRTMQGVWAFVKTPMGVIAAIYGFCVVFWGAAIVLFLLKWINLHNASTQGFWVEVSSQVVNALFTVTGVGLIPWRVIDTYRILRIWRYKRLTRSLRKKAGLPVLYDEDDLPDPMYDPNYVHVLSDKEQKELHHHQRQFMKSQTWYRPHGTPTHRAFPIDTALLICCCIDGNSIFQCILCGTMWGLNRFQRPAWSTGTLIPVSFLCGIMSAVFIWRGGQKTKRTKEVRERLRLALTLEQHPEQFGAVKVKNISQILSGDSTSGARRSEPEKRTSDVKTDK
ncbi:hypothetical protein M0805_007372 [Coniferiporia weirii]|nr:hypothetical protein M0805_007372 [Coniferiporia weirii]